MSTPAQKFLQKLAHASSFDINGATKLTNIDHRGNTDDELRLTLQEKRTVEDELRKTKNSLDAVVSELVLSENEVCTKSPLRNIHVLNRCFNT